MNSPFYLTKREYEVTNPLFWLPDDFAQLEERKPVYLTGSRGTGKTCLLQALFWQERLRNQSLREALNKLDLEPFSGKFIGVFLPLPTWSVEGFDRLPVDDASDDVVHRIRSQRFSLYLELLALHLFLDAIVQLRTEAVLDYDLGLENTACQRIIEENPGIVSFLSRPGERQGFPNLRTAFYRMYSHLGNCAGRKIAVQPDDSFPHAPVGSYLKQVATHLMSVVRCRDNPPQHLKLCIDEAESLKPAQQKVVNTIVRTACDPVSLVVAYGRKYWDTAPTLIPGMSNSEADFAFWDLDERYRDQGRFAALVSAVSTLRLQDAAREAPQSRNISVDLKTVLGSYGVNDLMQHLIHTNRKTKPTLVRLVERAAELRPAVHKPRPEEANEQGSAAPIYLRYLMDLKGMDTLDPAQESALRKLLVSALIHFCRTNKFKGLPYAGESIVLHLSNGCIRDFLAQMNEMYQTVKRDPVWFSKHQVPILVQKRAIVAASAKKLKDIPNRAAQYPSEVQALITGLGRLRQLFQHDQRRIDDPERGVFRVARTPRLDDILEDALIGGLITQVHCSDVARSFTIHQLYCPFYGLSYRRPYHTIDIAAEDLLGVADSRMDREREAMVKAMVKKLTDPRGGEQLALTMPASANEHRGG